MKTRPYILHLLTALLLLLWIPVALDKLWDLEGFHRTLLRQPFPEGWAGVLYWLLPILELLTAVLLVAGAIVSPNRPFKRWGFVLSALLMLAFTVFILLGVLGWYDRRPCGCGSVISGLSWEQHLWFNLGFLLISLWGWWLVARSGRRQDGPGDGARSGAEGGSAAGQPGPRASTHSLLAFRRSVYKRFTLYGRFRYPRKFALFPGRPEQTAS